MKRCLLFLLAACALAVPVQAFDYPKVMGVAQDHAAPFDLVGQLLFFSGSVEYVGSGTVIRPSSVLTAGHNVFDATTGWSTKLDFHRGNYGTTDLSVQRASRLLVLGGYRALASRYGADDIRSFAYDTAGLIFPKVVASGRFALMSYAQVLLSNSYYRVGVGYGAEGQHSGDYPLQVKPTTPFVRTTGSFFENYSIYIEGGMSGGPLFSYYKNNPYVAGVIVSGTDDSGGIRIVDVASYRYVNQNLK